MTENVEHNGKRKNYSNAQEKLAYWLSKTPTERVAEVERLRRKRYGDSLRMKKVARVIHFKSK